MMLSAQLFTTVDEVISDGPSWSLSILSGVISLVPSAIWAEKNEFAGKFELEAQLIKTGRFPDTDLAPTPILESVFQLGLFLGPAIGYVYGLIARWLLAGMYSSYARLWLWVLCAQFIVALSSSESTTSHLIVEARSAVPLVVLVLVVSKLFYASRWSRSFVH